MNGLAAAQRAYDRQLPHSYFEADEAEEVRNVSDLSGTDVVRITEEFIREFAEAGCAHTFMDDAGLDVGDLDALSQKLAQKWLTDCDLVFAVAGDAFFKTMKQVALSRWVNI